MSSVQETKQVLDAALILAGEIVKASKDGFQISDIAKIGAAIAADEGKKAALEAALKDVAKVPEEIKAIDLKGGLELAAHLIGKLPEVLEMAKAEAAAAV